MPEGLPQTPLPTPVRSTMNTGAPPRAPSSLMLFIFLLLSPVLALPGPVHRQDPPAQDSLAPVRRDGNWWVFSRPTPDPAAPTLQECLAAVRATTRVVLVVEPPVLVKAPLDFLGERRLPPDAVFPFVQGLLLAHGLGCIQVGAGATAVVHVLPVNAANAGRIRSHARFVPPDEVAAWQDRPAFYIRTIVRLTLADVATVVPALQEWAEAPLGMVAPVPGEQAVMIQGFPAQVASLLDALRALDGAASGDPQRDG